MAEITPIAPLHPTIRPRRIESDDKQRREQPQQQKQEEDNNSEPELDNEKRSPHIDERV